MTEEQTGSVAASAREWCEAWNRRDLDAVMTHYAEDVEFSSPTVVQRWGLADGWLRGKDKLRANFEIGMQNPDLQFEWFCCSLCGRVGLGPSFDMARRQLKQLRADLTFKGRQFTAR